jgi:hypothetical protein
VVLSWLEKKLGFLAMPHLVRMLVLFQFMAYVFAVLNPPTATSQGFLALLNLETHKVLQGEVWRLFTFLFVPRTLDPLWLLLALWVLWIIGEGVEQGIGRFKLTVYVFLSTLGQIIAAFLLGWPANGEFLFYSLLLGFASLYPEQVFYLFFVLPVKVKWFGYFMGAYLGFLFVVIPYSAKLGLILSLSGYLLFFAAPWIHSVVQSTSARKRLEKLKSANTSEDSPDGAFHKCCVCGATEISHPDRFFRVAPDGREYCNIHLMRPDTHEDESQKKA